jgi:hypothetical protein
MPLEAARGPSSNRGGFCDLDFLEGGEGGVDFFGSFAFEVYDYVVAVGFHNRAFAKDVVADVVAFGQVGHRARFVHDGCG